MEIYKTLTEAVIAASAGDNRRIYMVEHPSSCCHWVLAASPAQAALAVIGEEHVGLVSQRERYDATREALNEVIERHNANAGATT